VTGYAWYPEPNTATALLGEDGSFTALGKFYASIGVDSPNGDQLIQPDPF
jgi:hypothetical protein